MRATGTSEEREILHIARADLDHVAVFLNQIDTVFIKCFRHDLEPVSFSNFRKYLQPFFAQALESIWRSTWLERAAAKETGPAAAHDFGNCECLGMAFDGAGSGDDCQFIAPDRGVAHADYRLLRSQIEGNQLVWLADTNCFADAW